MVGNPGLSEIATSNFQPKLALESSADLEAGERLDFTQICWWLCQSMFYYILLTHAVFSHVHTHFYRFLFHDFVEGWDDHGQHPVSPLTLLHSFKVFLEQRADVNFHGAPAGLTPLAVACLFLGAKVKGQGTSLLPHQRPYSQIFFPVTFIFTPNRFSPQAPGAYICILFW